MLGVGAGAHAHGAHALGQPAGELVVDAALDVDPVGGGAGLAAVAHLGDHGAVEGQIEVRVIEDQERSVAAEFHGALEHVVGRLAQQVASDARWNR